MKAHKKCVFFVNILWNCGFVFLKIVFALKNYKTDSDSRGFKSSRKNVHQTFAFEMENPNSDVLSIPISQQYN